MNKSLVIIILYIVGLIYAALELNIWSANTGPKALLGIIWTVLLLICLFITEKNEEINILKLFSCLVYFYYHYINYLPKQ